MSGRTPKIPPHLEHAVREYARAHGQRPAAAWLKSEHGINVTHVTVGNLMRAGQAERGVDNARRRTATPPSSAPVATSDDVDRLERHIATLDAQAALLSAKLAELTDTLSPLAAIVRSEYRATTEQLRKLNETKAKISPSEPDPKKNKVKPLDVTAALAAVEKILATPPAAKSDAVH